MHILLRKYVALALFLLLPMVTKADFIGFGESGPGEITNSWAVSQACGRCGPVTTAEFFIVEDTGAGPWDASGVVNPVSGWETTVVNPNYSLSTGPSDSWQFWTENFLGDISSSVTINLLFWNGNPFSSLSFSAAYTRSVDGSQKVLCQTFGQQLCSDMKYSDARSYDRSVATVSEPGILALLVFGLTGLGLARRRGI